MKLKLTLISGEAADDVVLSSDATATTGQIAERLRASHPRSRVAAVPGPTLCLRVNPGTTLERTVGPMVTLGESGLRSGDVIAFTNASSVGSTGRPPVATLRVVAGADAGQTFNLTGGTTLLGRDRSCEVRLSDPLVSKRHAKINVTDMVEVIDDNSANGVQVGDEFVQRAVVRASDEVRVGDTTFTVTLHSTSGAAQTPSGHTIDFNRSPRLDPKYHGIELVAPEPPQRPQPQRFPIITLIAPLLMGAVMWAITHSALSIMFMALSPVMMVGSYFENKHAMKKAMVQATADFRSALRDLAVQLQYAGELERAGRRHENPSIDEVRDGVMRLSPLTWTRRPEHDSFAQVRLGLGVLPSRNTVKLPTTNNTIPALWRELHDVAGQFAMIDRVPVVADLRKCGNVGVAGPTAASHPLAAATIGQIIGLHSPAELVLAAMCTAASMRRWEWLKWLPHVGSEHSPLPVDHLVTSQNAAVGLIAALEDLLAVRSTEERDEGQLALPLVVLLVEDDAAVERARLVRIAEYGPANGIHVVWAAPSLERIPAACRTYLEVDPNTGEGRAGFVQGGAEVKQVELEPLNDVSCREIARQLAPVVDAGALLEDQSDLPRSVSFLTLGGRDLAENPADVLEMWRGSNSMPPAPGEARLKRDNSLRALVGQSASDLFYLDLRTQGPHALVGGTTGAGKSEFLQSWILGMATAHSPARVNFLFVDYKGGAAFADCVNLPHCVGLVTDLSPHLVRRALRSLNAELRRREVLLNAKKAKDLLELERRRDPDTPPSLVIIVDEFAALVHEVPEFVEGVVNVAQRGRSLGLHLILATQRPAGVIKDNLRANTNLRVALRMADEGDSDDVIGTKQAAMFDPSIPGRGVAKTGPGRLTTFQSAYVGGYTTNEPPIPLIEVNDFRFNIGAAWEAPDTGVDTPDRPLGNKDIRRMVTTVSAASTEARLPAARKPWLPELAVTYRLEQLPAKRTDAELVFGVIDRPDDQSQPAVAFVPDRDGNMAIFGTGGSGKSTLLRSLAIAAGFSTARGGPCFVYALDFGARGLSMLEALPHVGAVVTADDQERTLRLLRMLRSTIDERAERYAKVNAATIQEYRDRASSQDEPRILLLVDNFGAFRQAYELNYSARAFETLEGIAADGRGVGVHVIATADQSGVFTASMNSVIQSRLALRLTSDMDFTVLGVPPDVFSATTPPGRGFMDDSEVQVAVIGGEANIAKQAAEITKLVKAMERAAVAPAPPVARLPELVTLSSIVLTPGEPPTLGIYDQTLAPMPFEPAGVFIVAGPPQSGKTTAVTTMVASLRRAKPSVRLVLFAARRSQLAAAADWAKIVAHTDDIASDAGTLVAAIGSDAPEAADLVVVLEHVGDHTGSLHEDAVLELVKACRGNDLFVIAEGETSTLSGWGLMQAVRQDKYGIVLQPDEGDGDTLFTTSFPRLKRADFPVGRGMYVRGGRTFRVQVATPD
jgi:S-DNA-T family DNA segregation ATPase FtsK/SpoIIIE